MSGISQTYVCTDESLRIQGFSTDIQQTKEKHKNNLREM